MEWSRDRLLQYLHDVLNLEKNIYVLKNSIEKTTEDFERHTPALSLRTLQTVPDEPKLPKPLNTPKDIIGGIFGALMLFIVFALISLFLLSLIFGVSESASIAVAVVLTLLLTVYLISLDQKTSKENASAYQSALRERAQIIENNKLIEDYNTAAQSNYQLARHIWSEKRDLMLSPMRRELEQTEKVLRSLYEIGPVYSKYHSMAAIAMFCEYIESNRCSKLDGYEGAYNIYENELRMHMIVVKLDEVLKQMDAIRKNQYLLVSVVKNICDSLSHLENAIDLQTTKLFSALDHLNLQMDQTLSIQQENKRLAAQQLEELRNIETLSAYNAFLNGARRQNILIRKNYSITW